MRITMQIDDGEPNTQPTAGMAPPETSDGGAAPAASGSGAPETPGDVINAGPPPAYLLEALGDTPRTAGPSTDDLDGGAAPAEDG